MRREDGRSRGRLAAAALLCATISSALVVGGGSPAYGKQTGGLTLTLWHSTSDSPALKALYKGYEKESGNKIEFVNISVNTFGPEVTAKWATGARPDILEWNGNPADAESINASKDTVNLSKLAFAKKEVGTAALSGNIDGQTYAATLGPLEVDGVFYNKQVFAKAGLKPPTDYADIMSDCKAVLAKESGVTPIFEAGGTQWPTMYLSILNYTGQYEVGDAYSKQVLSGKATLSNPNGPLVKGMEDYDALRSAGCFNSDANTATWTAQTQSLLNGTTALIAGSTEDIPQIYSQANNNDKKVAATIGFVPVSATKPVANASPSFLGTYYVPKTGNSAKQQAAIDFIKYITTPSVYQKYVDQSDSVPTLSGAKAPKKMVSLWAETAKMQSGSGLAIFSALPGLGPNMGTEADALLTGQQSPQTVAQKLQAYYQEAESALGK